MNDQQSMSTEADAETFYESYEAAGGRAGELSLAALRCALDAVLAARSLPERDVVRATSPAERSVQEFRAALERLKPGTSTWPTKREPDQFVTDDPGDTRRTGFAPGELEATWDAVERTAPGHLVTFGQLDFCPFTECQNHGQTHDHHRESVRLRLPPDPRTA